MDWKLITYLTYLAVSVVLTVWVGRVLFRNGMVFLNDVFPGDPTLAAAINRLLVVGFYLVNFGFDLLTLRYSGQIESATKAVEVLSLKLGVVLVVVGILHLGNVLMLSRTRRHRQRELQQRPPLLPPTGLINPPQVPQPTP